MDLRPMVWFQLTFQPRRRYVWPGHRLLIMVQGRSFFQATLHGRAELRLILKEYEPRRWELRNIKRVPPEVGWGSEVATLG